MLGTIDIVLVTQNADGHVGAGHGGQLDGARETLVTLRVIVLEADLELDSLEEVTLLGLGGWFSWSKCQRRWVAMARALVIAKKVGGVLTNSTQGARRRADALRRP